MLREGTRALVRYPRIAFGLDPSVPRQLTLVLLVAAVSQVVLLRLVTRVGVHLPKDELATEAVRVSSLAGTYALNLTSILVTALAALLLAVLAWRTRPLALRWTLVALAGAMFWGLGLSLTTASAAAQALFGVTATVLAVSVSALLGRSGLSARGRLALGLAVVAYVAYQYYALGHLLARELGYAAAPPFAIGVLRLGELFVVLAGGAAFWAWGAERWRRAGRPGMAFSFAPVVVIAVGTLAPAATTSILALWTTGLSLYLPLPLYLLSLGLYLLTIAACWRSGDAFWISAGLLLVLLAGYMPEATHDHLLLLLGVALVAGAGCLFEPERAPSR
jgi:hypothetical protein